MSESSNALSLPGATSGALPNLNVVPPPAPPPRKPYALSQAAEREIALAQLLVTSARVPAYVAALEPFGINAAYLTALENDLAMARQRSGAALNCTNAKEGATASEGAKKEKLVQSLRHIQSIARANYEGTNPQQVKDYLVGEDIVANRPVIEGAAATIINRANADRPGGIDTDFIVRVTNERTQYVAAHASQQTELGKAKQERALRQQVIASIRDRRQRIQRAADAAYPWPLATSAEARVRFALPKRRPYAH